MKSVIRTATALAALLVWARVSSAQHEGHPTGGAPTAEGACLAHAKEGLLIVENANRQLEEARQANSPQQMRAAVSELQAALAEIRTQLSLCVRPADGSGGPGMEGMDHSGMKGMDPSAMEGMDHSKMGQEKEKPPVPKAEKPPTAEMDHSKMGQGKPATPSAAPAKDTVDPVCGMDVGRGATEKATYQGKTYYFCSKADRERFLSDPERYGKH